MRPPLAATASLALAAAWLGSGCASSPVHDATASQDPAVLKALLDSGAAVEERDQFGYTPLMTTAMNCAPQAAKTLLERGANPNAQSLPHAGGKGGTTALHLAYSWNCEPVLDILLAAGADPSIVDGIGMPPAAMPSVNTLRQNRELRSRMTAKMRAVGRSGDLATTAVAAPPAPPVYSGPASDVDAPKHRKAFGGSDFALVIGVETYHSLPKADYAERDAATVAKHLEALGMPARNIVSLKGADATRGKLQSYLGEWLPRNAKANGTLFVYFSGHGAPDPVSGDAYLMPWDGDANFLKSTAYPLKDFYAALGRLKTRRTLVALDACFSGAGGRSVLAAGARPLVAKVADAAPAGALTVLAAASGTEITGSLPSQGHGLFTYYLLKGLAGAARGADGSVTPRGLFAYLSPAVQDEARRQNRDQTPVLQGAALDEPFVKW